MADNVLINAGTGVSIACDDVSSVYYQRVKLDFGADGAADPVLVASGMPTQSCIATPTPYNLTLTNANTEYSQALSAHCRGFEFQCQSETSIRFAFVTGKVATPTAPYITLKAGDYFSSPPIHSVGAMTIYFASATAGVVVEILEWV